MPLHSYDDAVAYLLGRINYERNPSLAERQAFRLDRMRRLLAALGDPQERIPAVHIAGTKGKGSVAMMTAAALTAAGLRTGLYTSPHLVRFEERMRVDGETPSPAEFADLTSRVAAAVAELERDDESLAATYFEAATAMAWEFFARRGVEIAVLEVGLGGRLDATNVCRPKVVAITNISRDHTALLGETPAEIAFEKAGIIKPGVPCVSGVANPDAAAVVRRVCVERNAPLFEIAERFDVIEGRTGEAAVRAVTIDAAGTTWGPIAVPLAGRHQAENAAVALHLLKTLADRGYRVGPQDAGAGWANLNWPARVEVVARNPTIVIDAAHNVASVEALVRTLDDDFQAARRILLFAASREKDIPGMLGAFAPAFDSVVLTAFHNNPRAMPPDRLLTLWQAVADRPADRFERSEEAFDFCRRIAGPDDLICVAGSFFLAAEIRPIVMA
ncbi:MAG: bifunctional folylpolyglutamate synthase/dihydrofolate synthase [Planctomycetota bacterium]|nr:bifunctional folylpolyglutamate synthase/dihydrofolate synthase [Planctomycetota bacterium]